MLKKVLSDSGSTHGSEEEFAVTKRSKRRAADRYDHYRDMGSPGPMGSTAGVRLPPVNTHGCLMGQQRATPDHGPEVPLNHRPLTTPVRGPLSRRPSEQILDELRNTGIIPCLDLGIGQDIKLSDIVETKGGLSFNLTMRLARERALRRLVAEPRKHLVKIPDTRTALSKLQEAERRKELQLLEKKQRLRSHEARRLSNRERKERSRERARQEYLNKINHRQSNAERNKRKMREAKKKKRKKSSALSRLSAQLSDDANTCSPSEELSTTNPDEKCESRDSRPPSQMSCDSYYLDDFEQ